MAAVSARLDESVRARSAAGALLQRPHRGKRHGQVGPCRAQDRIDARQHRHTSLLRSPRRSEPWRSGNDHGAGCADRIVQFGRERRVAGHRAVHQARGCTAHRDHRQSELYIGARSRRASGCGRRRGGVPSRARSYSEHHCCSRARRCAGGSIARSPRLRSRRFCAFASRRRSRPPLADLCARRHASRRRDAIGCARRQAVAGDPGDVAQRLGNDRGSRRGARASSVSLPTAICAALWQSRSMCKTLRSSRS